jgi:hypothetical protein
MNHLFTSFIVTDDCQDYVKEFYTTELIPLWAKIHTQFFESITVVTNLPHYFDSSNLNILTITLNEAFCGYHYKNLNITGSQVGAWVHFLNSLPEDDVGIYLDPDAFMLNDRLIRLASNIKDHALTKIVSPMNICDAGVAVLRKTGRTQKMLNNMKTILSNTDVVNHIEVFYNNNYKGNREFLIPWYRHSLLLRDVLCGISPIPDTIHDCTEVNIPEYTLNNDCKQMLKLIRKKKQLRHNYLPN